MRVKIVLMEVEKSLWFCVSGARFLGDWKQRLRGLLLMGCSRRRGPRLLGFEKSLSETLFYWVAVLLSSGLRKR